MSHRWTRPKQQDGWVLSLAGWEQVGEAGPVLQTPSGLSSFYLREHQPRPDSQEGSESRAGEQEG